MIVLYLFLFCFHELSFTCTIARDTITLNQTIRDGQTIVSPEQAFELGFFSPGNATHNRYLGIWYKRLATGTVVWVANRETPIKSKTGELTLEPGGVLVVRDSATNATVWSSDSSSGSITGNPVDRLLDSGNLMVIDGENEAENYVWQSFDHPGNTKLPGMRIGRDLDRGIVTNYTSWKSDDDPSIGEDMVYYDFNGLPQMFVKRGDVIQSRIGSWNGLAYTSSTNHGQNSIYTYKYVSNERETYSEFDLINSSVLTRMTFVPGGYMARFNWINRTQGWFLYFAPVTDGCERYALCGVYGICDIQQAPACGCLKGFTPKRPDQWDISDWTSGCKREIPLECGVEDGF